MRGAAYILPISLLRGWPRRVRSAAIHDVSLAQAPLAATRGWASDGENSPLRWRAEVDRLQQEVRLLREEIRIKDLRMQHLEPQKRSHYPSTERLAIQDRPDPHPHGSPSLPDNGAPDDTGHGTAPISRDCDAHLSHDHGT